MPDLTKLFHCLDAEAVTRRARRQEGGVSVRGNSVPRIGTAGWSLPRPFRERIGGEGSQLEVYARVFNAVEVNSTFSRAHRPATLSRWAASTGSDFRFSVKVPKSITHERRLVGAESAIDDFLARVENLGAALGPLLLQLPPSLPFDAEIVEPVCDRLQGRRRLAVVCEPRHASWFTPKIDRWLAARHVARVAADPARHVGAGDPGGWRGLSYYRLHGAPTMYYSDYDAAALSALAARLSRDAAAEIWCIFDNTALGAAASNAFDLTHIMQRSGGDRGAPLASERNVSAPG